jgi:hypothetical protein
MPASWLAFVHCSKFALLVVNVLSCLLLVPTIKHGRDASTAEMPDQGTSIVASASLIPYPYLLILCSRSYLAQRVIPMLPRLLCEQLCSLNPGQDRFAFSVVWEMDREGHIQEEWVGRSIINTCGKLAYPMVQQMIEGNFAPEKWPQVELYNGATWDQVCGLLGMECCGPPG